MLIKCFQIWMNMAAIMGFFFFIRGEADAHQPCSTDADGAN